MTQAAERAGFTIIETIVAVAITGTVAIAVLGQVGAASRSASDATDALHAAALAESLLGELEALPTATLLDLPDTLEGGSRQTSDVRFDWHSQAARVPEEPALVEVAVIVSWESGAFPMRTRWYRP